VAPSPTVRRRRQSESASQEQSRLGLSLARTLVTTGCNFAVFFFCLRRRQPIVGFGSHLRWVCATELSEGDPKTMLQFGDKVRNKKKCTVVCMVAIKEVDNPGLSRLGTWEVHHSLCGLWACSKFSRCIAFPTCSACHFTSLFIFLSCQCPSTLSLLPLYFYSFTFFPLNVLNVISAQVSDRGLFHGSVGRGPPENNNGQRGFPTGPPHCYLLRLVSLTLLEPGLCFITMQV
jgi:hypothetical protein